MSAIGELALWLAAVTAGWSALLGGRGGAGAPDFRASAVRGLHASAATACVAVATLVALSGGVVDPALGATAWIERLALLWSSPRSQLVVWAAAVATCATLAAGAVRRDPRVERDRAGLAIAIAAGLPCGLAVFAAAFASPFTAGFPPGEARVAVELRHAPGLAARVLLVAAHASIILPIAARLAGVAPHRERRLVSGALSLLLGAWLLSGWVRYARVHGAEALPPTLDPGDGSWLAAEALRAVPALMLAAWIAWLARTPASRRWSAATVVAAMLATLATAVAAFGFVPLAVAWVQDRPLDTGPRVAHAVALWTAASIAVGGAATTLLDARGTGAPPRALWALAAVGVATIFAALAYAAGARGAPALVACIAAGLTAGSVVTTRGESPLFRHAAVAATLALASWCAALSRPPRIVTLAPGATSTFAEPGRSWSLVGQGTSTDEGPTFDGAIVAVEVRAPDGDSRVVAAGERLYRQAHGHGAERGVLPAVDRGVLGDLRLTVEAVRADTVAFRVRAHPLVTLAWASSLALVLLLGAAAFTGAAHGNE